MQKNVKSFILLQSSAVLAWHKRDERLKCLFWSRLGIEKNLFAPLLNPISKHELPRIFGPSYGPILCVHETPSSLFVLHSSITATKWGEIISEVEFTFLYGNGLNAEMPLQKILDPKLQSSSAVEFYRGEKETVCSCLWQPKSIDWPNLIFVDSFSCHMLHSRCFPFPSFLSTLLNSILIS